VTLYVRNGIMRVSKKYEFVFVSTPKACTHTIYKILKDHFYEGLLEIAFHDNKISRVYKKFFRWTIVRDPFSRVISLWWSGCRLAHLDQYNFRKRSGGQYDFTKFVVWLADNKENKHNILMMNQSEWLAPTEPIHIIHLEKLKQELEQLPFWKEGIEIPQLNTTTEKIQTQSRDEGKDIARPPFHILYKNSEAVEAVIKWAEPDFDRFGYEKEIKWLKK